MEASPGGNQVGTGELMNQATKQVANTSLNPAAGPIFQPATETATVRMRCPVCRKLYAVESRFLQATPSGNLSDNRSAAPEQEPPLFDCVACYSRFSVKRPMAPSAQFAETYLYDPELELVDELAPEENKDDDKQEPRAAIEPALPQQARTVGQAAPLGETRECPKCGTSNPKSTDECVRCGVLFAKYNPLSSDRKAVDFETLGRPELANLWAAIVEDYDNQALHDKFVAACQEAGCLPFASHKYSRILSAVPREELATKMRNRVLALTTHKTEERRKRPSRFRMPGLNSMTILLGVLVTVLGVMLPNMQNLTGIGVSLLALSVGMRFFLRQSD